MEQTTAEVRVRDETRVGVKALVDSGLVKIPKIYIHPAEDLQKTLFNDTNGIHLEVPTIDLGGVLDGTRRKEIVKEICEASERVGFFQLINQGVPISVLDATDGVRCFNEQGFNEQPSKIKMRLYTPHPTLGVRYYSNEDFQETKCWRDTLSCFSFDDKIQDSDKFPSLISNNKFKSVKDRVVAKTVGPRISVACFLSNGSRTRSQPMGPIKELLFPDNPPIYKE
ncbi:hypothetical protein RJ639_014936, partial [Escallonia herrerae]